MFVRRQRQYAIVGGRNRIFDGADQPATSRAGGALRRRSSRCAGRLALEVDDEDVVLDDQHLAEMEIAVQPDLQPVDIRWQ